MILQAICNQREAGVAICISDKIRFQDKKTNTEKNEHFIIIKKTFQEDQNAPEYINH